MTIVGAGLVGPVAAMMLAARGYVVSLHDHRPDPATAPPERGRSVHVLLSARGWRMLARLGCDAPVRAIALPLVGRHVRSWDGQRTEQAYSRDGDTVYCVERSALHATLIAAARRRPGITCHWRQRCVRVDADASLVQFTAEDGGGAPTTLPFARLLVTDGAFSATRAGLKSARSNLHQQWLDLAYKELRLPAAAEGGPSLDPRRFQLWPRNRVLFAAFPNPDGSFTGSLFMPWRGAPSFESIRSEEDFSGMWRTLFPDLSAWIPVLWPQYHDHPESGLMTVRAEPWHWSGRVLLLGDAAHAVVPFFGQGMNCGFEDVEVLERHLDVSGDAWAPAIAAYAAARREDVDALADLSLEHYAHLSHVPDPRDAHRERLGALLDRLAPTHFRPLYELVAFTTMPYATARRLDQHRRSWVERLLALPFFTGDWPEGAEDRVRAELRRAGLLPGAPRPTTVGDVMSRAPATICEDASIGEAVRLLRATDRGELMVVDVAGRWCGVLSEGALLRAVVAHSQAGPWAESVGSLVVRDVPTVGPDQTLVSALPRLGDASTRALPVVEEGRLVGALARDEVLFGLLGAPTR